MSKEGCLEEKGGNLCLSWVKEVSKYWLNAPCLSGVFFSCEHLCCWTKLWLGNRLLIFLPAFAVEIIQVELCLPVIFLPLSWLCNFHRQSAISNWYYFAVDNIMSCSITFVKRVSSNKALLNLRKRLFLVHLRHSSLVLLPPPRPSAAALFLSVCPLLRCWSLLEGIRYCPSIGRVSILIYWL